MTKLHLQGVGKVNAKKAVDFKVGDKMVWNFGSTSTITGVAKETKAFITYIMTDSKMPEPYERKLKKDRLVGFEA